AQRIFNYSLHNQKNSYFTNFVAISFPVLYVFKIDKTIKKETQRLEHCHMLFSPGFSMKHTAGDIY
ncbi:MAG: hypothetical protein WBJ46_09075, partial [Rectinema sp.]